MSMFRISAKTKQTSRPWNALACFKKNGFVSRLLSAMATRVPAGYEDETGFHLEEKTSSIPPGQTV